MEYRAAIWRTRRLAAEPCPLWSIGPFAINVLPLKAQVKDRVTRSPTPHHPLKFEITFCVRGVISKLKAAAPQVKRGARFYHQGSSFTRPVLFANGIDGDHPSSFQVKRAEFDALLLNHARES